MKKIRKCENCGKIQLINDGESCKNCGTIVSMHTNENVSNINNRRENTEHLHTARENNKYYLSSITGLQECKEHLSDQMNTIGANNGNILHIAVDSDMHGLFTGDTFSFIALDFEKNKSYTIRDHIDEFFHKYNQAEIEELTNDEDEWKKSEIKYLYENIDVFNPTEIYNNYKKVVNALKVDEAYITSINFYASTLKEEQHIKYSFDVTYTISEEELFKYVSESNFKQLLEDEDINTNYSKIFATVSLDVHYDGTVELDVLEKDDYNVEVLATESHGTYMNSIEIQFPYPNLTF